ncbi:MAG: hypothetical protein H0T62_04185 [Parachlamydiaceae bacterium]|nr:hypothetical protein [Parachlamydiaceae bacterium]
MLKLEKIAKTRELSVLLRAKPTLLTSPFLFALSYAVFIHLAAIFIFQISPFKIGYQQSLFPPVSVATEIPVHEGVYASNNHFEEEEPIAAYLIAPSPLKPPLPSAQAIPIVRNIEYIKQKSPLSNPFLSHENILDDDVETFALASSSVYAPLTVQLSGAFADIPLEFGAMDQIHKAAHEHLYRTYRFVYSAHLDQERGEFFCWDLKDGDKDTKAENYALDILKGLHFTPIPHAGPLSGEVSMLITLSCNESPYD